MTTRLVLAVSAAAFIRGAVAPLPPGTFCGNGLCELAVGETKASCPDDCPPPTTTYAACAAGCADGAHDNVTNWCSDVKDECCDSGGGGGDRRAAAWSCLRN